MVFSLLLLALLSSELPAQQAPSTGRPTFADAVQMANEGRDAEALVAFERLVTSNPNDREARLWIARLHERNGDTERAEAVYRSVLLEDPISVDAMVGVASAEIARNELSDAVVVLERSEKLAPLNPTVLAMLGRVHRDAGRDARALDYFERAYALAPTEQNQMLLEDARRTYGHRAVANLFAEDFNSGVSDTRSGEIAFNLRMNDTWRVSGRGQVQRKFAAREERAGAGVDWRWTPRVTLRGQALVGFDAVVMAERDYLGELDVLANRAHWTAGVRYFDFEGARTTVVSPAVSFLATDRLAVSLRYALSISESNTFSGRENGHTAHIRGEYRLRPRIWVAGRYAAGVDDFDNFSRDRIGDFSANSVAGGVRFDLPRLLTVVWMAERQWRENDLNMTRLTVSVAQTF
jgi:tetratricopeptide (TPR) repeat protein